MNTLDLAVLRTSRAVALAVCGLASAQAFAAGMDDWNVPKAVSVWAVDNGDIEGERLPTITDNAAQPRAEVSVGDGGLSSALLVLLGLGAMRRSRLSRRRPREPRRRAPLPPRDRGA